MRRLLLLAALPLLVAVSGCSDPFCSPHGAYTIPAHTDPAHTDLQYQFWYFRATEDCSYSYTTKSEQCTPGTSPVYHWVPVYSPAEYHPTEYVPAETCGKKP